METFSHPRWEDYEYTYMNSNPFGWFGNETINVDYLNDENIDFPFVKVFVNGTGRTVESTQ